MTTVSRCLALFLTGLMLLPPGNASILGHKKKKPAKVPESSPLTPDERALQALNRLTFGPRPGEVAAVEGMGLDKWIDQQLHPETIDDSALEGRLAAFPAMRLNLHQMVERYPSPAMIRQAERGKLGIPGDPVERAIYTDQIAALRERQEKKQAQDRQPGAGNGQPVPAQGVMASVSGAMSAPAMEVSQADPAMQSANLASANMQPAEMMMPDEGATAAEENLYADLEATGVLNLAPQQRVAKLVSMQPEQFRDFLQRLNRQDRVELFAGLSPEQKETVFALINPQLVVGGEVLITRVLRDIYSQRQLEAVMTDFWLNHFNVYLRKGEFAPWYLAEYQDKVIRPHALGKFEDLLVATAQSPAMLFYLDQSESAGPHSMAAMRAATMPAGPNGKPRALGLNENYARELMELHTLGVDGGYTQRDVTELAKVFTGWGIEHPDQGGEFVFNPRRHEPGQKVVLGYQVPGGGEEEGLEMLHLLAISPATAHHVSFQIAQRFVSDQPPAALVDAMAATWVKTGGDIREVLRTMLSSPEFWSRDAWRAKVKTPEEYVISAVRASGGEVVHPVALVEAIGQLGMPLFGCQTPNGYAWTADAWLNSGELLDRMNFSLALSENNAGILMRWDDEMQLYPNATPQAKESRLEAFLLNQAASVQTRNAALQQLSAESETPTDEARQKSRPVNFVRPREFGQLLQSAAPLPPPEDQDAALLAGLLLGSPEFQRR